MSVVSHEFANEQNSAIEAIGHQHFDPAIAETYKQIETYCLSIAGEFGECDAEVAVLASMVKLFTKHLAIQMSLYLALASEANQQQDFNLDEFMKTSVPLLFHSLQTVLYSEDGAFYQSAMTQAGR